MHTSLRKEIDPLYLEGMLIGGSFSAEVADATPALDQVWNTPNNSECLFSSVIIGYL